MQFLSIGKKLYYEEKYYMYLQEHNEFCWSFQNKMKLPTGHSTWTFYIFFFLVFSIFSIDRECYNKEKSVPTSPTLGKYETLPYFFFFYFYFFSFSFSFLFLFLFLFRRFFTMPQRKVVAASNSTTSKKWEKITSSKVFYIWSGREMYLIQLTS